MHMPEQCNSAYGKTAAKNALTAFLSMVSLECQVLNILLAMARMQAQILRSRIQIPLAYDVRTAGKQAEVVRVTDLRLSICPC